MEIKVRHARRLGQVEGPATGIGAVPVRRWKNKKGRFWGKPAAR